MFEPHHMETPALDDGDPAALSRRQQEVLDALEAVFLEQGFREPTIQELAARASCSRRTLYEIAPSKGEMFLRVLDRMMGRLDRSTRDLRHSQADPAARIEEILGSGVTAFRPAGAAFAADLANYGPARMLFARYVERIRGSIIQIVREGVASGAFRNVNPEVVAEVVIVATRQVTEPAFLSRTGMRPGDALTSLYDFLRQGLVASDEDHESANSQSTR